MKRGDVYRTSVEMLWKPDPNIEAARQLPEWARFHRLCGEHDLFFDRAEPVGKQYKSVAFTVEYAGSDRYRISRSIYLGNGVGSTVVSSTLAAYDAAGREIPGAREMLMRGLAGAPVADLEDLLG